MTSHVVLNQTFSDRGDPVEVLDVEYSEVFDRPNAFLADRRFRLIEPIGYKIPSDPGVPSRILIGCGYPDGWPFLITSSLCSSTDMFFLWVTYSSRTSLASNGPNTFSSSVRRRDIRS